MSPELEQKLYNKYPKIFAQKDLSPTETCMCWGFECGDGWFNIIDKLCENIQNHINKNNLPQLEAEQVKQKFGTLRFYTNGNTDECIDKFITEAEEQTYHICETCGSIEDIKPTQGWISYLCASCRKIK